MVNTQSMNRGEVIPVLVEVLKEFAEKLEGFGAEPGKVTPQSAGELYDKVKKGIVTDERTIALVRGAEIEAATRKQARQNNAVPELAESKPTTTLTVDKVPASQRKENLERAASTPKASGGNLVGGAGIVAGVNAIAPGSERATKEDPKSKALHEKQDQLAVEERARIETTPAKAMKTVTEAAQQESKKASKQQANVKDPNDLDVKVLRVAGKDEAPASPEPKPEKSKLQQALDDPALVQSITKMNTELGKALANQKNGFEPPNPGQGRDRRGI